MSTTKHDASGPARLRRTYWLALHRTVGKFLDAEPGSRLCRIAEDEMYRLHTKLDRLGVRSIEGMPVDEPEGEEAAP